ncbi:MAG: DUF6452 family protein [Maribacter sp.]
MRRLRIGLLFFIGILAVASCEKDDICVEGNTPLLVIEFYDITDTTLLKEVPTLRVLGEGQTVNVNTFTDRTALNTISIPLRTEVNTTGFVMISNSATSEDGLETGNVDTLNFSYTRIEDFLSRGCGFVVTYDSLTATLTPDTANWIREIRIAESKVITSDTTHVKIFH